MNTPLSLRVMSFNIHGGRPVHGPPDLDAITRVIEAAGADLIGLQEVHRWMPPPFVFQNQPAVLRERLGLELHFARSFGWGPCGYGSAIQSRILPLTVERIILPGRGEPRVLLDARFLIDGHAFRFLNTHLGLDAKQRETQLAVVAERIRGDRLPLILTADLNVTPDAPELEPLFAVGLRHAVPAEVPTFPADAPRLHLDYLMVTSEIVVKRWQAVETAVSDHRPLLADLELPALAG